jgi:hypothetical protein
MLESSPELSSLTHERRLKKNNAQTQEIEDERPGRRTACMLAIFSIKWTRLRLHRMYMTPFCSPISATQRPHDSHNVDLPAHERSLETRAFPIVSAYSNERTGLPP